VTVVFLLMMTSFFDMGGVKSLDITKGDKVGVLELTGVIFNARPFVDDLESFTSYSSVKAIVIRIDSPGGAVAASQEIYNALKRARQKMPIIVSMGNVAASGGYYAALGADSIVANPGTTTGSIGVIAQLTVLRELMDKIGVKQEVIKSGKFKDTGSPFRDMTPAEKEILQQWVDDTYDQFTEAVSLERDIPLEEVRKIADGRVFTGRQALNNGLIDVIGDFDDAVNLAGKMAGIKGQPNIIEKKKRTLTLWDLLFGDLEGNIKRLSGHQVELMYILP